MVQLYKRKGGDVLVNTETLNQQSGANIAILPGGGFVITWTDNSLVGGDASNFGIKAQLFDADGDKVGGEFLVNTTTTNTQSGSFVAALASGRFVITWTDASVSGGDMSGNAVRGQLFEANGTPVGGEFLINTATTGSQTSPQVTELSGGGFVVGWTDASGAGGDNSGSAIKAQLFDANAAKVGGEFLVNTEISGSQNSATLIALGTGFAVAWTGAVTAPGGIVTGSIRLQLFDATGAKVGTEQVVNASNDGNFNTPNISALGSGFIVTWAQQDSAQGQGIPVTYDVHAQLFDANGVKVGGDFVVNSTTAGTQSAADVDLLPGGGFIVTWSGPGEGTSGTDVFGQFFDASGAKVGSEFVVAGGDGTQNGARVDVLPNGDIVVIYNDTSGIGGDTSVSGIKMQVLTLSTDAPTDITISGTHLTEVAIENLPVATLGATNAGAVNSHFTYEIITDSTGGAFRIDGDQLVVDDNSKLDFETAPHVDLRIRVTDLNGMSYEENVSLDVGNTVTETRYAAGEAFVTTGGVPEFSGTVGSAALASGGFVVVTHYMDIGDFSTPTTDGYRAQIFDADGTKAGSEKDIVLAVGAGADMTVTGLASGGFLLAYRGASVNGPSGNFFPIEAQILDAAGNPVGSPFMVSTTNGGIMGQPSVATLGSGGFVVSWSLPVHEDASDGGPFPGQVRARIFDANGQPVGDDFRVNTGIEGEQAHSHVAALSSGGFVVSWTDDQNSQGTLEAQRFDAAGNKVGSELTVASGFSSLLSDLAALPGGGFVAAWTEVIVEGDVNAIDLKAQIVDANGVNVGSALTLATILSANTAPVVHLTATADGGFLVTWDSLQPDSVDENDNRSLAQFFDASGRPIGDAFVVGDSEGAGEDAAFAVRLASGDVAFSWGHTFHVDDMARTRVDGRVLDYTAPPANPTQGPDTLNGTPNADTINGLGGNDVINGLGGNDRLDGGTGADTLIGGTGDDWYFVDNAADAVTEAAGEGNDRVFASVSYTLGAGASVEKLSTTNNAGTAAINLSGNELAQAIYGNDGANVLDGKAGADQLIGLKGDDWYYVDNAGDQIQELAGQGSDRVFASVSYTLGAGQSVEKLTTTNNAGTTAINLTGNELTNIIYGNDGANILDGGGGRDFLSGLKGDDWYYVRNVADVTYELAGEGNDRVFATVSYALFAGQSVEKLTTANNAGTDAINLSGNELVQDIYGNAGNNILDGKGGADLMVGAKGDDFYYVDSAGDRIAELAGEGNDRLFAGVSYVLAAGVSVEKLTTTNNVGTEAINLTGNELAQDVYGNDGNNSLDGKGGADLLVGLKGDDFYYVDNAADRIAELAGQGNDRVVASTSYILAAGVSAEKLTTTTNAGTAAINLTGNELAQTIYGNEGANVLDGKAGADALFGLGGADQFRFTSALGGGNVDRVGDFQTGVDKIALDDAVFTGTGSLGTLDAGAFVTGASAQDADDRIIYNATTGALFFDADGAGGSAAILFATITPGLGLSASDFLVI